MSILRRAASSIAVLALATVPLGAETTLEEVLAKYYEAIGGIEAWRSVETLRLTGRLVLPGGEETPFSLVFARPGRSRLEYAVRGRTAIQAFDGESAWVVTPLPGADGPVLMTSEQTELMREQADFEGPLVGWQEKGHSLELAATGGETGVRVRVTLDSGAVRDYILDPESYLPVAMEMTSRFEGEEFEIETLFGDYRAAGSLVLAHSVDSRPKGAPAGQVLLLDDVELGVDVDDRLFTMPATGRGPVRDEKR